MCGIAIRFDGNTARFVQCSQSERHETQRFIIELLSRSPSKGILPTFGRICNNTRLYVRVLVHAIVCIKYIYCDPVSFEECSGDIV